MNNLKYYAVISIFFFISITSKVIAQDNEAITVVKEYAKALEEFQFDKAYGYILPEEQEYKNLENYKAEYPIPLLKALRLANPNFFKFTIVNDQAKPEGITIKTFKLDVNEGLTYLMLFKIIIPEAMRGEFAGLDPKKPEDIFKVLKAMFKKESKLGNIPFKQVEKNIKLVKVADKWYVNPGWKEAGEAVKAEELKRKVARVEGKAKFAIDNAKRFGKYQEAIDKLITFQKDAPESEIIKEGIALLKDYISNIKKLKIKVVNTEVIFTGKEKLNLHVELKNESKFKIGSFQIVVSHFDDKNVLLKKNDNGQIFTCGDFTWEPQAPDGCLPGYTGKWKLMSDKPENWAKTTIEIKSVTFSE